MIFKRFWQAGILIGGSGLFWSWWRFLAADLSGVVMGIGIAMIGIAMLLFAAAREY